MVFEGLLMGFLWVFFCVFFNGLWKRRGKGLESNMVTLFWAHVCSCSLKDTRFVSSLFPCLYKHLTNPKTETL